MDLKTMTPKSSAASSDQIAQKNRSDVTSNSLNGEKLVARTKGEPKNPTRRLVRISSAGSLEDLLAEQRIAVERALAFNSVIVERLAKECPLKSLGKDSAQKGPNTDTLSKRDDMKQKPLLMNQPGTESSSASHQKSDIPMDKSPTSETLAHQLYHPLLCDIEHDAIEAAWEENQGVGQGQGKAQEVKKKPTLERKATIKKKDIHSDMFPIMSDLKDRVKGLLNQAIGKKEDYLSDSGFWAMVAQHQLFHSATLFVIVLNTVWIAYDTDHNKADVLLEADLQFQVVNIFFCTFFTCEILIRLLSFKRMCCAFWDAGFLWDFFLVALMAWETWVTSLLYCLGYSFGGSGSRSGSVLRIFRIFRLLRVARAARLFQTVPELMVLAKGMVVAFRSVMVVLGLLAIIIYIFSIVMTQLLAETTFNKESGNHFLNVPATANFLLLQVLCGFDPDFANDLLGESILCYSLFLLYLLIGSLTIMNMLIGILCDVVTRVAANEEEEAFMRDMDFKVDSLAEHLDLEGNGFVTREEFYHISQEPDVIVGLHELGVDVAALMDFAHVVFQESEEVSYKQFHHMILQFRDGKEATVKDIMEVRMQISMQLATMLQAMKQKGVPKGDKNELNKPESFQQADQDKYDFYLPDYVPVECGEGDNVEEDSDKSNDHSSLERRISLTDLITKHSFQESPRSVTSNKLTANDDHNSSYKILKTKEAAARWAAQFLQ